MPACPSPFLSTPARHSQARRLWSGTALALVSEPLQGLCRHALLHVAANVARPRLHKPGTPLLFCCTGVIRAWQHHLAFLEPRLNASLPSGVPCFLISRLLTSPLISPLTSSFLSPFPCPCPPPHYHVPYQADMWSLAVTLYEVIVGAKPFQASDLEELKVAVLGRTFAAKMSAEGGRHAGCSCGSNNPTLTSLLCPLLTSLPTQSTISPFPKRTARTICANSSSRCSS